MGKISIIDFIPEGRSNAISRQELSRLTKSDDRTIRKRINKARNSGEIIMSNSRTKGYWKPTNREELIIYIKNLRSYIISLFKIMRSAKKRLKVLEGQEQFDTNCGSR